LIVTWTSAGGGAPGKLDLQVEFGAGQDLGPVERIDRLRRGRRRHSSKQQVEASRGDWALHLNLEMSDRRKHRCSADDGGVTVEERGQFAVAAAL